MSYTERLSEKMCLLTKLSPVSVTNGAIAYTSYVSLANYHRAAIVIHMGVMAGSSTVDAVVHQATNTSGGSHKALDPTKAITQLTQASGDSGKSVIIEVHTDELDVGGGFSCIALGYTVGAAASIMTIAIYGFESRFEPVSVTAWDEVVD